MSSLKWSLITLKTQIKQMEEKGKLHQIHSSFQLQKEHPYFVNVRRLTAPVVFV